MDAMMTIHVNWRDESQSILCYQFVGSWTLPELRQAFDRVEKLVQESDSAIIHIISDLREGKFKMGISDEMVAETQRGAALLPASRYGSLVLVGAPDWLPMLIKTLTRYIPQLRQPIHYIDDMQMAEETIYQFYNSVSA